MESNVASMPVSTLQFVAAAMAVGMVPADPFFLKRAPSHSLPQAPPTGNWKSRCKKGQAWAQQMLARAQSLALASGAGSSS